MAKIYVEFTKEAHSKLVKIKRLICLVAVLAIISTTAIIVTKENTEISTTQLTSEKIITKSVEGITEETIEVATDSTVESTTNAVETTISKESETQTTKLETSKILYSASNFEYLGIIYWNGWKWTWYSEKVLPGNGLNIPGRHTNSSGYVCDENGYICLASSSLSKGTIIETPFGVKGKIYDSGCASNTIDVYVNW